MKLNFIILLTLVLFSCNSVTERMDNFEVHGIDVSRYQSDVDWKKIAAQDISFAFVKTSEGETIVDSFFCKNWYELKEAGIKRGAYHFFRPTTSVISQAENFMNNLFLEEGDLPPVLDVEVTDGVSSEELVVLVKEWLTIVETQYQIRPIIYTNLNFYNKHFADHLPDYPVWIARYNRYLEPLLTNSVDWKFWQYGNRGRLEGINGNIDFNVFRGTLDDLEKLCYKPYNFSLQ